MGKYVICWKNGSPFQSYFPDRQETKSTLDFSDSPAKRLPEEVSKDEPPVKKPRDLAAIHGRNSQVEHTNSTSWREETRSWKEAIGNGEESWWASPKAFCAWNPFNPRFDREACFCIFVPPLCSLLVETFKGQKVRKMAWSVRLRLRRCLHACMHAWRFFLPFPSTCMGWAFCSCMWGCSFSLMHAASMFACRSFMHAWFARMTFFDQTCVHACVMI